MGQIVDSLVSAGYAGAEVAARVSFDAPEDRPEGCYVELAEYTGDADCVIDFSNHLGTVKLLDYCVSKKLPVVVATTGQTAEEKEAIYEAAKKIPVFYSANMSLGVAALSDLAKRAAAMFPEADIEIVETHHNRKLDVPSGTALLLADSIKEVRPQAVYNIGRPDNGKRTKEEIGIHSIRLGNECGTHEIIISTGNETITLKHKAENRSIFAEGAIKAAAYICGKPAGLYNMRDYTA